MLQAILDAVGIEARTCAGLIGVDAALFDEWVQGRRAIPQVMASLLAATLGVDQSAIVRASQDGRSMTPAVWYKFRGEKRRVDRECVALIRQLAYRYGQFEEASESPATGWRSMFSDIRDRVDKEAPPAEQGRVAARMFLRSRGLSQCRTGIGEVLRSHLRSIGLVVIETPLPESKLEGCSFVVGKQPVDRPCVFANSYRSTWFSRNATILHEVGHAIFELPVYGSHVDYPEPDDGGAIAEERAQAFMQEALVPPELLECVAQALRVDWDDVSRETLAKLVAHTHAEPRLLLRAAFHAGLVDEGRSLELMNLRIAEELRKASSHALSAAELLRANPQLREDWIRARTATLPSRALQLPVPYVAEVVRSYERGNFNAGKAAELLMMDKRTFERHYRKDSADPYLDY